ncbi:MAG TPA: DNA-formamidopyrimidine glycosylase [Ktedonobacterales bacterium]|nr:DNA-formamidopyrimidine glycosylase [Ktedonobacterales bacterium]
MPELPEVEYVARQLRQTLVGRTISDARVNWPRTIAHPDVATFCAELPGAHVLGIDRRAKYLLITLSGDQALLIHRRMTGNLLLFPAAADDSPWEEVPDPYCRAVFLLDDGCRLVFTDPRKFGRIALYPTSELSAALHGLGLEPLGEEFTPEALGKLLAGRSRQMKPLLLDQTCIAGIGNIYADESLFRAGIHPLRRAETLTPPEVARLHAAIREVLELGIEHGGTTFGRHQDIWGEAGRNRAHLAVYQRAGEPCLRCGTPLVRVVVAQRGTHFCPTCQPGPAADTLVEAAPTEAEREVASLKERASAEK